MSNPYIPYHPIIYVRGFAGTQGEIDDTVGDPYMGFNIGSTKSRQVWDGKMRRYYFESPLVRLKDEPFRGLDAMSKELRWEYYAGLYEESHRTNFFVTTDLRGIRSSVRNTPRNSSTCAVPTDSNA